VIRTTDALLYGAYKVLTIDTIFPFFSFTFISSVFSPLGIFFDGTRCTLQNVAPQMTRSLAASRVSNHSGLSGRRRNKTRTLSEKSWQQQQQQQQPHTQTNARRKQIEQTEQHHKNPAN
jgi:hypothetical protein